ncbi:MAG: von Willebrand factor type A domain-containing protein [Verrucomicrobiota bacterium]|nr:von Willebrand factor type A domain-containing protein [Verrucomicrobiota bacterium]
MSDSTEHKPKPFREQLEARVVAMLLGEASPFEEEQLREQLKTDAALTKFCAEIEQTLPLLNEALDVGQAPKAKSPKSRLAGKRRSKLKQLFRSKPGFVKRDIVRLDFRKALAIAAAVCAVLFVTAGLLLPSLAKSKDGLVVAANSKPVEQFGERVETEEKLRADVAGVGNYARVKGVQVANERRATDQTVPSSESAPSPSRDHISGKVDFLAGSIEEDSEGTVLYDESGEEAAPLLAEGDRSTAATEVTPARGKPDGGRSVGRARNRPQIASKRELADLALPVGTGGMGMGGGGFVLDAHADGLAVGQPVNNSGVAAGPVSGGVAGAPFSGLDADRDGEAGEDGKLYGFGGGQAARDSDKTLGAKGTRKYSGRSALESPEGESVVLGQAFNIAAGDEVESESLNGQNVRWFAADKSTPFGKSLERDQSGAEVLYFQSESILAEAGAPVGGAVALGVVLDDEVAKESGQAEVLTLGEVPTLGRMFKKRAELEKATDDLSVVQMERSADTKAPSERGRTSGESARQSQYLAKQDKDVLAESPALGSDRQQRLAEKHTDKRRKSQSTRQPKSSITANRELLRRKGKPAANKKLPTPAAKPQSASRSSRLPEAKREEKQLVEKLKDAKLPAKSPTPSVVYTPRPETVTAENNFSTFSLNVSDVSFKIALASLQADKLPAPANVRSEEFLNSLEYRDPMPRAGEPLAFHWERARSPFAHDRDFIRFSVRTAALGRQRGRAVNLVCLLDNSGSMEREDRVSIVQQALDVLARKLTPSDRVSLITFSRTPELRADGMRGGNREAFLKKASGWIPQGGTHVEKALALAYETAKKHFIRGGNNRVILLTDGAANMGNVDPYQLRKTVESHRKQGIALDCFGIGWEGYNDNLLEVLARNGDGRYGFLNQPAQAVAEFEQKLLGAFQVAASDVKVQVEWNADRVRVFRQVGYLRHQLKKEDFRNNKIDAAEISAAESGNALYVVQVNPDGEGPLGVVRVRYKVPFASEYTEMEWSLAYESAATPLEQAGPAMRLGSVAATFAEWLAENPYAQGVQLADLQGLISGIPSIYGTDPRPTQLEWMINKARILAGN